MPPLEGIDVSHCNGSIDWSAVKGDGISFAIIKATEGTHFVDPECPTNVSGCRNEGIVCGMYHFYRHDVDPEEQAATFLRAIGRLQPGDLTPAVDVEAPGDGAGSITYPQTEVVHRIGLFVNAVQSAIGSMPMIYTYPAAWKDVTGNSNAFASTCPLWIASYGNTPVLPASWVKYATWQYTDSGRVSGIDTIVDRDRSSADAPELQTIVLRALALSGKAIVNQDANVREAPGLGAPVVEVLDEGALIEIVAGPEMVKDQNWWKVDDGAGTVGWCSGKVLSPA